jgi:hypothetical protein
MVIIQFLDLLLQLAEEEVMGEIHPVMVFLVVPVVEAAVTVLALGVLVL